MPQSVAESRRLVLSEVSNQLDDMGDKLSAALPAHIPAERFKRVVLTAIQGNMALVESVDRKSLFNACMKAAQDGLLPDGREGAIVPFQGQAQWMPMVTGIRKKARNSGEIADWFTAAVYEKDAFSYQLGDKPFVHHEPTMDDDPGRVIAAYSIAILKDGTISRDVMPRRDIEKRRAVSKAKRADSPWEQWYEEMAMKTVARHHAKELPMSTDLDRLLHRDDELYNFDEAKAEQQQQTRPKLHQLLDHVGKRKTAAEFTPTDAPAIEHDSSAVAAEDDGAASADPSATAPTHEGPPVAGAAPDAPVSEDEAPVDTSASAVLYSKLLGEAAKGWRKFRFAFGKLRQAEVDLLTQDQIARLNAVANQADAKSGGE